ncbi:substrate-binding domain-containing protein [Streptomyces sp. S.PNR 29]|uniref:substrate-binding domain-containing protein n=1 Tax=Streptomyces sp. S.PNR 29 TaxID=2973805 RepID=UPI0025B11A89|nr:substrate-binding domain-containing protein [Streptomyces sp. S.PNR 29]MDN0194439.1 substrate-binding domain-containing protein [Streptomyces sp. S.PNR 29]
MNGFPWEITFAVLGLTVPVAAALWEFVLAGRKRLGYRVQMDTTAGEAAANPYAGVLQQMQQTGGAPLHEPSFVLLRFENSGWAPIVEDDYLAPAQGPVGIHVRFRGRRVVGMVVTELSRNELRPFFVPPGNEDDTDGNSPPNIPGLGVTDGRIELPKVRLNRRDYYKVLAVLEREAGFTADTFPDPEVTAGIVGGVRGGAIRKTEYYPFASRRVRWLLAALVLVLVGQSLFTFTRDEVVAAPLDCAEGTLTLSGSTAFAPVLREAARQYEKKCSPGARIPITDDTFKGSVAGLDTLAKAGENAKLKGGQGMGDRLAFSDGQSAERPQLVPRPVALSLFALVVNPDTGVKNLTRRQIRDIYAGKITNWSRLNGKDVPIHLVSRYPGSGTRATLERQVLGNKPLPAVTAGDCASLDDDRPGRCEVGDTQTLLDTVATTPGALGHSEIGAATAHSGVQPVRIDGFKADLEGVDDGAYPYWQTEYAYTYGEPPADSPAASFLRYLANEVGKDIIRSHGDRPCSELERPLLCRPG